MERADLDDDIDDDDDDDDAMRATMMREDVVPRCQSCAMTMTLVTQTYAPTAGGDARAVFAYACARGACAGERGGRWACVRAQQRRRPRESVRDDGGGGARDDGGAHRDDEEEEEEEGKDKSRRDVKDAGVIRTTGVVEQAPEMEDTWDDPSASAWCDDSGVDALSAELDAMLATTSTAPAEKSKTDSTTSEPQTSVDAKGMARLNAARAAYDEQCPHQFVEYFLVAEAEPPATTSLSARDAAHAEALLATYAAREGVSVRDIIAPPTSSASGASEEDWTGEAYEVGEAAHVDDAYLKFHKRLQRAPEQCMRYAAGGMPVIWPTRKPPTPKPCERCNKMRVCELQLTPALIRDVEDALGMYKGSRTHLASEDELLAWDWQTVCVFTCPDSCWNTNAGENDIEYVREQIEVAESEASRDALLKAIAME